MVLLMVKIIRVFRPCIQHGPLADLN